MEQHTIINQGCMSQRRITGVDVYVQSLHMIQGSSVRTGVLHRESNEVPHLKAYSAMHHSRVYLPWHSIGRRVAAPRAVCANRIWRLRTTQLGREWNGTIICETERNNDGTTNCYKHTSGCRLRRNALRQQGLAGSNEPLQIYAIMDVHTTAEYIRMSIALVTGQWNECKGVWRNLRRRQSDAVI